MISARASTISPRQVAQGRDEERSFANALEHVPSTDSGVGLHFIVYLWMCMPSSLLRKGVIGSDIRDDMQFDRALLPFTLGSSLQKQSIRYCLSNVYFQLSLASIPRLVRC